MPDIAGETAFTVQRVETHPRAFRQAGRAGLLHVVRVVPPPKPNPYLLRDLSLKLGVTISMINELDDADHGYADFDIRSVGQTVLSWHRLESAVDRFGEFLNAGQNPEAYVEALFGSGA